jgi:hypothetical protein
MPFAETGPPTSGARGRSGPWVPRKADSLTVHKLAVGSSTVDDPAAEVWPLIFWLLRNS